MSVEAAKIFFFFGLDCLDKEKFPEAEAFFRKAHELSPLKKSILVNLSIACLKQSKLNEAYKYSCEAAAVDRSDPGTLNQLSLVLIEMKRNEEALNVLENILRTDPNYSDAVFNKGKALYELERWTEAIASFNIALSIDRESIDALIGLGNSLRHLKRTHEARAVFDKAVSSEPNNPFVWNANGLLLLDLGRLDEALGSFDRAISIKPDYADAYNNRGNSLAKLKRFEEALWSFDKAILIKADDADIHSNRGNALVELKRFEEGSRSYDTAISIKPGHVEATFGKALNLLREQNFSEGWLLYESRLKLAEVTHEMLGPAERFLKKTTPILNVTELIGKHLVLISEQGIGDVVMFASIAQETLPFVRSLDFVVDKRLIEIFQLSFRSSRIFSLEDFDENVVPQDAIFMFIGSLGLLFRKNATDFPRVPYLIPDREKVANWRNQLQCDNRKVIGISWKGGTPKTGDWRRSISLEAFLGLLPDRDVRLVNIQHNSSIQEVREVSVKYGVEILSFPESDTKDISDLSALLCALDHVVTVQNANIHLCGSLGVRCIGVIPSVPEWRYGSRGDQMNWYGSVVLVRMENDINVQELKSQINSALVC